MLIESVRVENFRSIKDETLACEDLTVLVGPNGSGKSSFLKALDFFYSASLKIDEDDFYGGETSNELIIAITYRDLSDEAKELFGSYVQDETLTVERVMKWDEGNVTATYHGASPQHPAFTPIRQAESAKEKKELYEALRESGEYGDLLKWTKQEVASENLQAWEASHPDHLVGQRDDGQFFGFKEVAQGYLGRFTRYLLIPAVREASDDAAEGKGSILTGLMDLVVRSVLAGKEAFVKLREETQARFEEILDPSKLTELNSLSDRLTSTIRTFVPDAKIHLLWQQLETVNIPLPRADVKLEEEGWISAVTRTGHGLQRAFILTMLQHLALAQTPATSSGEESGEKPEDKELCLPDLVLAVEEPELYQHPNRQRHFAKILLHLASGKTPGVAENTQVLYGTHSPLFVGIDRIDQIRLLKKVDAGKDKPKCTKIVRTSLDAVAKEIWEVNGEDGEEFTGKTLLPRLKALMTPWMSEGFFAKVAVLVEGEDDRAAILGTASTMGHDLDNLGISVIPCGGKTSLDRPTAIFRRLGINVYVVWDSDEGDKDAKPEDNHRLLRLMGSDVVDWPEGVAESFACFKKNLEETLEEELGKENFAAWLKECQDTLDIPKKKHAIKNPEVISRIMEKAQEAGKPSKTLEAIINNILALGAEKGNSI